MRADLNRERVAADCAGIVSLRFGILLLVFPAPARSIIWLIGSYALIFGILTLVLSFRLRGMRDTAGRQAARRSSECRP